MQRLLVTLIFVCFVTNIDARITCSQWLKEKGECTKFTGNYRPLAKKILKIQSTHCVDNNSSDPKDCVQQCCENEYVNPKKICTATEFKSTNNHSCSYFDKKHYPTARDQFLQVETCENEYMFEDPDNLESKIYADEVCVECGKCKKKPKDYEIKENEKKEQTKKENKKIPKKQKIDDDQNVNPKKVPNDQKTDTVKNVNAKKKHYLEKDEWKFYKNTNCYNSKGADQISDHVGDVEECKSICQKSTTCEGFVYGDPSKCELRKNIVIGECEYSSYWQMYVKPKISEQERKVLYDRLDILDEVIEIIREMTGNRKAVRPIISEQKSSSKKELKDYSADNDFTCPKSLPVFYNFGREQYGCTLVSPDYKFTTGGLFKKVHTIDDQLFYLLPALTNFLKEEEITKSKEKRVYLELVLKFGNESAVKNYLKVPILNFEVAAFMKTEVILNLKNQPIQVNGHVQLINIELKTHYPSTWFGQHWGKCVVAIVLTGVMYWHHFYKKAKKTENDDDESQDEKETEDEKQSEDDDANLTLSDDIKNDGNIEVVASEV